MAARLALARIRCTIETASDLGYRRGGETHSSPLLSLSSTGLKWPSVVNLFTLGGEPHSLDNPSISDPQD